MLHAAQYELDSVRAGFGFFVDFGLMGWHNMMLTKFEDEAANLYARSYPLPMERLVFLKLNTITMALTKLFTRISFSNKLRKRIVLRYDKYSTTICTLVQKTIRKSVLPDCWGGEVSSENFCKVVLERLKHRYHWSDNFRLPNRW